METFTKLFQSWLVFVYHCFDRIVISGYLMGLQRPGQVVYWLQQVLGIEAITKEVLSQRTTAYVRWVETYARNRNIPIEWAEKDVRKEDYVLPYLRRMQRRNQFGVYFIFQTMEQGWTFRPGARLVARQAGGQADYPILHRYRGRYRYYYFYLRDQMLGPMIVRLGTFIPFEASYYLNGHSYIEGQLRHRGVEFCKDDNAFVWVHDVKALQKAADSLTPAVIQRRLNYWTMVLGPKFGQRDRKAAKLERSYYVHQVEYCYNFVFRRNHPIRRIFERSCELGLWRVHGERIWLSFTPVRCFQPNLMNYGIIESHCLRYAEVGRGCVRALKSLEHWAELIPNILAAFRVGGECVLDELPKLGGCAAGMEERRCNVFQKGVTAKVSDVNVPCLFGRLLALR